MIYETRIAPFVVCVCGGGQDILSRDDVTDIFAQSLL